MWEKRDKTMFCILFRCTAHAFTVSPLSLSKGQLHCDVPCGQVLCLKQSPKQSTASWSTAQRDEHVAHIQCRKLLWLYNNPSGVGNNLFNLCQRLYGRVLLCWVFLDIEVVRRIKAHVNQPGEARSEANWALFVRWFWEMMFPGAIKQ